MKCSIPQSTCPNLSRTGQTVGFLLQRAWTNNVEENTEQIHRRQIPGIIVSSARKLDVTREINKGTHK